MPTLSLSTTQSYGKKELLDHLRGWEFVEERFNKIGLSYYELRLTVGLQTALKFLIFKNRGDVDQAAFNKFVTFVKINKSVIDSFNLSDRYKDILDFVSKNDYEGFLLQCRPRVLIAGHDLKFIETIEHEMARYYDIRYDKWNSHIDHDEKSSKKLLKWAEIIWCEWMLGNSEWYAKHKSNHQKMVIRMHRQELATNYAENIDFGKVDTVITVSALFFERLLERFPNIPREKVSLVPNFIDIDAYKSDWSDDRLFNLAMIGILPARKNLHTSLEVLKELRKKDKRYKLIIYSKKPSELAWLKRNKVEMAYFEKCDEYIANNDLLNYVIYKGHCDLKQALTDDAIGFVLSVSESDEDNFPGPESFHLAIADGFAGGGVSFIKKWAGCEYIFPNYMIQKSQSDLIEIISTLSLDPSQFQKLSSKGKDYIKHSYNIDKFLIEVRRILSF